MQLVNSSLTDLNGKQLVIGEEKLTVGNVLVSCAFSAPPPNVTRTGIDVANRWEFGVRTNKLKVGDKIDITPELLVALKEDLLRCFGVVVAGQMQLIIDGKSN